MSNKKALSWLLLISGILLVVLGVYMFSTPLGNFVSIAVFIAASMLVSGFSEIISFFSSEKGKRSGWMLASGIISLIFGIWTIFGRGMEALIVALPFIFAFWVLNSNIMRITGSLSLRDWGYRNWGFTFALGILGTIAGVILIFSPLVSGLSMAYLVPIMFIVHGISNISLFVNIKSN